MKIGVISDIHIPVATKSLPPKVLELFKQCDLIVHAGDAVERSVIDTLRSIKETVAVHGNMDSLELKNTLPLKAVFVAEGKNIGVTHGHGVADDILDAVAGVFKKQKLDIIIFGHSHKPFKKIVNGVLYFNPGSVSDVVHAPYRSVGIIEIKDGKIRSEIVKIDQ
ncbi:MAG TPA: metallophosphoesterase family protein [Candidatus Omnitrophota bacterium]|nr:metallophosphoesterase family protein [Candidatus Omnitrophota bacterium]HPS20848.1 metallophosphoesterase family protein [Candidatus Omnitrophota bacterium]